MGFRRKEDGGPLHPASPSRGRQALPQLGADSRWRNFTAFHRYTTSIASPANRPTSGCPARVLRTTRTAGSSAQRRGTPKLRWRWKSRPRCLPVDMHVRTDQDVAAENCGGRDVGAQLNAWLAASVRITWHPGCLSHRAPFPGRRDNRYTRSPGGNGSSKSCSRLWRATRARSVTAEPCGVSTRPPGRSAPPSRLGFCLAPVPGPSLRQT